MYSNPLPIWQVPWLMQLRQADRRSVQSALIALPGVGQKVADCVALFCLDKYDVIPVDTHVIQIARRDFPSECGPCDKMNKVVSHVFHLPSLMNSLL